MATNLTHITVGDKLAIENPARRVNSYEPSHIILVVDRESATQVACRRANGLGGEWRFRKSDGKQIGENYRYAEIATPELLAKVAEQTERQARELSARTALNDLSGKHLHQLHLTLEQTEALAKAWAEIKAMKPAA